MRQLHDQRRKRLNDIRSQLSHIDEKHSKLEAKGVTLEKKLRSKPDIDVDDQLMDEWFALVQEKNLVVREESDLVYELRDLELIDQHDQLEVEIRKRMAKDDSHKTELEKLEEEAMILELVELVEKRDKLLWELHVEKIAEDEELLASTSKGLPRPLQRSKTARL